MDGGTPFWSGLGEFHVDAAAVWIDVISKTIGFVIFFFLSGIDLFLFITVTS